MGTTDSTIGGLLGGLAGAITSANPIAGAALQIGGALIGSLVGPHYNATTNPDMYNSSSPAFGNYSSFLTNYQGSSANVNGTEYNPDNQYWTANGGTALSAQIANEINTANMSSLTSAQQNILQQLVQLNGGTSGDNLGISAEHQGTFTLASGQQISVTNLENLISQYQTAFGSANTSSSPIYTVGRSYPDFNLPTLDNTGTSTPPNGGTNTQVGNVTVVVQNPTIVGPSGLNDVAVSIGQAIQRAANGAVIGSPSTYGGTSRALTIVGRGLA
jgi:hypothetical protein